MTPDTPSPTLAVFGAGGATGGHVIRIARERGYAVRAIDHSAPDDPGDDPGVTHVTGDVLEDDLSGHVRGTDAVISCLGVGNDPSTLSNPPPLYIDGTRAICNAMQSEGLRRLVVISASFVEEKNRGPVWFKLPAMLALKRVFDQMAEMEQMLRGRPEIDWTAVRPGWLMEAPATDDHIIQADVIPPDTVRTRHADLAGLMVSLATSQDWLRATPAIARPEPPEATGPAAVLDSMIDG